MSIHPGHSGHSAGRVNVLAVPARCFRLALVLLLCLLAGCDAPPLPTPTVPAQRPATFQMLSLPDRPAALLAGDVPQPGLLPTLRLGIPATRMLGDRDDAGVRVPVQAGRTTTARFVAPEAFDRVGGYFGYAQEPVPTNVITIGPAITLTLLSEASGNTPLATQVFTNVQDRAWIDMAVPQQPAGSYFLQARASAQGAAWFAQQTEGVTPVTAFPAATTQLHLPLTQKEGTITIGGLPLKPSAPPLLLNQQIALPVDNAATMIYILGGTSSYDHGTGWWRDYEVQGDGSDRQFIGDSAGSMIVEYGDGTYDEVPFIFGLNMWWFTHWDSQDWGGPFMEPFASDQQARAALDASLQLLDVMPARSTHYLWVFRPQAKPIKQIIFADDSTKQGYPYIAAVTLEAGAGDTLDPALRAWVDQHALAPAAIKNKTYSPALERLQHTLYSFAGDWQAGRVQVSMPPTQTLQAGNNQAPLIQASGTTEAEVLSNIWYYSTRDMLSKIDANGFLRASTPDAPNWSSYQGIGTWRNALGPYANQSWSRDGGRVLLEFIRLGLLERADAGIRYADSHLYDLPKQGIKRDGVLLPPHWTTIINDPLLLDNDHRGDGNQENDGHGLLLLAHYRLWQARGRDSAWLHDRWDAIRDATDWFVWQLANPAISRAKGDVLYTESEASADGGYDAYSNSIALACLQAGVTMAEAQGDTQAAQRWRVAAQRLRAGMFAHLTVDDPQYGRCWVAVGWSWAYANESLGPLLIAADMSQLSGDLMDSEFQVINANTYHRQIGLASGFAAPRAMGYGQGFLTQAALLMDDQAGALAALNNLAHFVYFAGKDPYIVPEGVALHPDGKYWYRTNDLGNAAHEAEALKALALVAGVDAPSKQLVPRLPDGWQKLSVSGWSLDNGARLSYTLSRDGGVLILDGSISGPQVTLHVRIGPLPAGRTPQVMLNGKAVAGDVLKLVDSGGVRWCWIDVTGGNFSLRAE